MYFEVNLVNYDDNNIPYNVGTFVVKANDEPTKAEVKEFFEDNTDIEFESVMSIHEIDEMEALDYADTDDIYEL